MPASQPADRLAAIDAYWRAANYLGAAQIYLKGNALLREPLRPEHIKPRLLGHWGTQPGLNLVYAHLDRLIQDTDARVLLVVGPGHGAPAILANLFLEETLGDYYPELTRDAIGTNHLVRQFSWPGGAPSHLFPGTPGVIHEGGELGYCLSHAYGAVLDNPDLIAACVVGDGEAETGPLAAAWHSNKYLDPAVSGAVLPILHLNGYKLSGPTIFGRMRDEELRALFAGYGHQVRIVEGSEPRAVHEAMWQAMDWAYAAIRDIQEPARAGSRADPPAWPMIVLKTPKGWTGPKTLDGRPVEGTFHAHQVPIPDPASNPAHLEALEAWLRSYRPEELFDGGGRPLPLVTAICPGWPQRMGNTPHANGGKLVVPLALPDLARYAVDVPAPGAVTAEGTRHLGAYLRDVFAENAESRNFRFFCPDETISNRLDAIFQATGRAFVWPLSDTDEYLSPGGRVMEILSEHTCQGWLEGYLLTGRHGLLACYEAFIAIVDSMFNQYAKWLKAASEVPWRAPVSSLTYLLTSHVWRQDHNGYSHQVPSFINTLLTKKPAVVRIYLPPDANCLLAVVDHCLRSRSYVNLIVASKQMIPQYLDLEAARGHCARGASVWAWASAGQGEPDVVLAAAGDVPTTEVLAAASLLRREAPDLRVRVVNVVDLFTLDSHRDHPHGMTDQDFAALFTAEAPVVFGFHGYPKTIHELIYRRPNPERFHVRGYIEEGTTTTPFDMLVRNRASRYHLAVEALRRATRVQPRAGGLIDRFEERLAAHHAYVREHDQDLPEVVDWRWPGA